jgi:hypothetical protein
MRVLDECFPLLIGVAPARYDALALRQLKDAFERYFERGQLYAFVSVQPEGSAAPGAAERRLLMQWLESPRVQHYSRELCVGSAAVLDGAPMRGALTAILWFWKPPFPLEVVKTPEVGIDYCIAQLAERGVALPTSKPVLGARAVHVLAAALAEVPPDP